MSRRTVLAWIAATAAASGLPSPALAAPGPDDAVFALLDATGPLAGDQFHPWRALRAMRALHALGRDEALALLTRYAAARPDPPDGLFAVVRCLFETPPRAGHKRVGPGILGPGYLRPPALGAPSPPQPTDLASVPYFPAILLKDVPLVLVRGYMLGGQPEPLGMHVGALADATWRSKPFEPGHVGELRYLLMHWGRWPKGTEQAELIDSQLSRMQGGALGPGMTLELGRALDEGITLLRAGKNAEMLERFVHPDDRAKIEAQQPWKELVDQFTRDKAADLLMFLEAARDLTPRVQGDAYTFSFTTLFPDVHRDLVLQRVGDRFYIRD